MNLTLLDEQKVRKTEQELLEAMKKSDVDILDQLLHDDLLLFFQPAKSLPSRWIWKPTDPEI